MGRSYTRISHVLVEYDSIVLAKSEHVSHVQYGHECEDCTDDVCV